MCTTLIEALHSILHRRELQSPWMFVVGIPGRVIFFYLGLSLSIWLCLALSVRSPCRVLCTAPARASWFGKLVSVLLYCLNLLVRHARESLLRSWHTHLCFCRPAGLRPLSLESSTPPPPLTFRRVLRRGSLRPIHLSIWGHLSGACWV